MARKIKPVSDQKPALKDDVHNLPPSETIKVHSRRVACDGVGGALGHPRVWIELGEDGMAECGYCDRRFVLAKGSAGHEDEHLAPGVYQDTGGH